MSEIPSNRDVFQEAYDQFVNELGLDPNNIGPDESCLYPPEEDKDA